MLKSSAADFFFNACLCFLANDDTVGTKKQMQMYCIDDSHFEGSMEKQLIQSLLEAISDSNADAFNVALSEYNMIKPFNKFRTALMVKIKETHMPNEVPDFTGGDVDFTGAAEDNKPAGEGGDEMGGLDFT